MEKSGSHGKSRRWIDPVTHGYKFDGYNGVFGGGIYWDASVDEARELQTPVSKALQGFEGRLYEDLYTPVDEAERCLLTPEVKDSKAQQEMVVPYWREMWPRFRKQKPQWSQSTPKEPFHQTWGYILSEISSNLQLIYFKSVFYDESIPFMAKSISYPPIQNTTCINISRTWWSTIWYLVVQIVDVEVPLVL